MLLALTSTLQVTRRLWVTSHLSLESVTTLQVDTTWLKPGQELGGALLAAPGGVRNASGSRKRLHPYQTQRSLKNCERCRLTLSALSENRLDLSQTAPLIARLNPAPVSRRNQAKPYDDQLADDER